MATQKQIDANRQNAARSTGPKTDAGKANSRCNAYTHGCRAHQVDLLPKENAQAFQLCLDAWYAEVAPTNLTEARLVRQIAVLAWKLDRAERYELALLSRRVRDSVEQAKLDHRDRVRHAVYQLLPRDHDATRHSYHPGSAASFLATIEGSAEGCRELLYRWHTLENQTRNGLLWTPEDEMHAVRMLGGGPSRISDPAVIEMIVANRMLNLSPDVLAESFTMLEGPLGLTLDQNVARDACRSRPRDLTEARAVLMATADRAITRLRSLLEDRERNGGAEAQEIALAAELASFDMSQEAENLRKHHVTMQRQFVKSVETLSKLRHQELKMAKEWVKLSENRANEPNLEEVRQECRTHNGEVGPTLLSDNGEVGPTLLSDIQREMEQSPAPQAADVEQETPTPEIRANEPNLTAEVQVTCTPERESTVEPTPPAPKPKSRRARKNRERALRRRLGKS